MEITVVTVRSFYPQNFLGVCNQEFLARGSELLKLTRNGDLHRKIVSVYFHQSGEVMLKMKSEHLALQSQKELNYHLTRSNILDVVLEVCKTIPALPRTYL